MMYSIGSSREKASLTAEIRKLMVEVFVGTRMYYGKETETTNKKGSKVV
jgi:hypothetical protein